MKKILGTYNVVDCEHWGDVERDENYLRENGCEVISHYWDGHDCGEAYIDFSCKESDFVKLYKKFGSIAHFNADINDYIKGKDLLGYKRYSTKELHDMMVKMDKDLSNGFENRLAFYLWFEVKERPSLTTEDIITECLKYLTDYEIVGYETNITDGNEFMGLLIKTTYKNLTNEAIGKIGDSCMSNLRGWLGLHNIYGECRCGHVLLNRWNLGFLYVYVQKFIEKIHNREDLQYRGGNYYYPKDIVVSANEYFDEDGTFKNKIVKDGTTYTIKDPRFWLK